MPLTGWSCGRCGLAVDGDAAWTAHLRACRQANDPEARDAELARKVKAGDIPGRVPEHHLADWWPKPRDVAAQ